MINYKILFIYLNKEQKKKLILFVLVVLIASVFETLGLGALIPFVKILNNPQAIHNYIPSEFILSLGKFNTETTIKNIILINFISIYIFNYFIRIKLLELQTKLPYELGAHFAIIIYSKIVRMDYSWHKSKNSSEIVDVISNKSGAIVGVIIMTLTIVSSTCISLFIASYLFFTSFEIMSILFLLILLNYAFFNLIHKKNFIEQSENIAIQSGKNIKLIQESLRGIRDIILDRSYKHYIASFTQSTYELRSKQANSVFLANKPKIYLETFIICFAAFVIFSLDIFSTSIDLWLPTLAVIALGIQKLIPYAQSIYTSRSTILANASSYEDALSYLSINPEAKEDRISSYAGMINNIKLVDVNYSYENFKLINLNIDINSGDRIGIIGGTGSGKSTFLDILMGLIQPDSGMVLLNGRALNKELVCDFSHVPQNIFLFDGTIYENIVLNDSSHAFDDELINNLLIKCQLHEFINSLNDGILTRVGENGIQLSGGQRQRIGIARALYKKSKILILDEATSALDIETEQRIMNSIYEHDPNLTLIIVAHRISTLSQCNRIIKIENGKLFEG